MWWCAVPSRPIHKKHISGSRVYRLWCVPSRPWYSTDHARKLPVESDRYGKFDCFGQTSASQIRLWRLRDLLHPNTQEVARIIGSFVGGLPAASHDRFHYRNLKSGKIKAFIRSKGRYDKSINWHLNPSRTLARVLISFASRNHANRAHRQSGFPTFISCQRQDANVQPKRRQSLQGDKLCDVSTVPLVARWPVFLARGSDADGEPHCHYLLWLKWYTHGYFWQWLRGVVRGTTLTAGGLFTGSEDGLHINARSSYLVSFASSHLPKRPQHSYSSC